MTHSSFTELGIVEPLRRALEAEGYTTPTPIQTRAIPELLAGRDLLGLAQTGTGKTAAFALPILQRLSVGHEQRPARSVRALILAPTRELVIQISDSFRIYGKFLHLRHAVVVGGVGQGPQVKALAGGVDILVATPSRLLDLVRGNALRLGDVECLVLDEADRMLDMGFIRDIRRIVAAVPRKRQSMLFSATMPTDVEHLANSILHQPVRIDISPPTRTAENIDQRVFYVSTADKRALLSTLLVDSALERVLVFTRTKHAANRVAEHLGKSGVDAEAIHGNKSQGARQRALERFRSGSARVLVATDIAARGIDIDNVTHVINFELPNEPESYVHRIGRTARAGAAGIAISFCDASENAHLRQIERLTKSALTVMQGKPGADQPAPSQRGNRPSPQRARRGGWQHRGAARNAA
ncbi:MAG TPA: DEAD/DEAH box helicase [Rhizomicrobium sp.]|nr:DEAD/DEAH box helicase [Rhizomicrobium sp.]